MGSKYDASNSGYPEIMIFVSEAVFSVMIIIQPYSAHDYAYFL